MSKQAYSPRSRASLIGLTMVLVANLGASDGFAEFVRVQVEESREHPIAVRGPDPIVNLQILEEAERAFEAGLERLGHGGFKRTRFQIDWNPLEERKGASWEQTLPRKLSIERMTRRFMMEGGGDFEADRERWMRTFAVLLTQAIMYAESGPPPSGALAEPPLWLSEGLTQFLLERNHATWERVVWRFYKAGAVPSLEEIQGVQVLPEDKLARGRYQAFAFWLVRFASEQLAERQTLGLWLQREARNSKRAYWASTRANDSWWRQKTGASDPREFRLWTWEQSASRLREALHFSARLKDETESRLISVIALPRDRGQFEDLEPVRQAQRELGSLQASSHILMQPILFSYMQAMEAWFEGDQRRYLEQILEAQDVQKSIEPFLRETRDYLDWIYVNYGVAVSSRELAQYSLLVQDLESERYRLRRDKDAQPETRIEIEQP